MDETMPAEVWYDERFWKDFDVIKPRTPLRNPMMPVYLGCKNNVAFVQKAPFWVVAEPNGVHAKQFKNPYRTMEELEYACKDLGGDKGKGKGSMSRRRSSGLRSVMYVHWWSQLYYKDKKQNKDSALWDRHRSFGWCHRIDKGTSGLMLLALTKDAHDFMREQWHELDVWKKYICLARGYPPYATMNSAPITTTHQIPDKRGKGGYSKSDTKDDGKPAQTFVEVLGRYKYNGEDYALCSCEIITGRTHQIRTHMEALGHPLVGDQRYGVKGGKCPLGMNRPFLHAVAASFMVPDDNFRLIIVNALTPDLMDVLRKLDYVGRGLDNSTSKLKSLDFSDSEVVEPDRKRRKTDAQFGYSYYTKYCEENTDGDMCDQNMVEDRHRIINTALPWFFAQGKSRNSSFTNVVNLEKTLFAFRANCDAKLVGLKLSKLKKDEEETEISPDEVYRTVEHLIEFVDVMAFRNH